LKKQLIPPVLARLFRSLSADAGHAPLGLDLHYPAPEEHAPRKSHSPIPATTPLASPLGPTALPGTYTARLTRQMAKVSPRPLS